MTDRIVLAACPKCGCPDVNLDFEGMPDRLECWDCSYVYALTDSADIPPEEATHVD